MRTNCARFQYILYILHIILINKPPQLCSNINSSSSLGGVALSALDAVHRLLGGTDQTELSVRQTNNAVFSVSLCAHFRYSRTPDAARRA